MSASTTPLPAAPPPARRVTVDLLALDLETCARCVGTEAKLEAARQELATCLRPMVERLAPLYREAVLLVDLQGLTHAAAAVRLGLSTSGTKSRVQRGRRALEGMVRDCCRVQLDAGGRVMAFEARRHSCRPCAAGCAVELGPEPT